MDKEKQSGFNIIENDSSKKLTDEIECLEQNSFKQLGELSLRGASWLHQSFQKVQQVVSSKHFTSLGLYSDIETALVPYLVRQIALQTVSQASQDYDDPNRQKKDFIIINNHMLAIATRYLKDILGHETFHKDLTALALCVVEANQKTYPDRKLKEDTNMLTKSLKAAVRTQKQQTMHLRLVS